MAWPFLDGVVKVVVTWGFDGFPSVNVHFVYIRSDPSPVSSAGMEIITDIFQVALEDHWEARMPTTWTVDEITATDWTIPHGEQVAQVDGLPITGTNIADALPASVALVASHRTNSTGRSFRGRTYMPGMNDSDSTDNIVGAGMVTDLFAYFDALDVALNQQSMDMVVLSLYADNEPRATPVQTAITNRIINTRVDTQRRRLPD